MHISFFYLGLGLIFVSGTFYNPLVGVILTELTSAMIEAVAPTLAISETVMESSRINAIFWSIYGIPLLVTGLILVRKYRK